MVRVTTQTEEHFKTGLQMHPENMFDKQHLSEDCIIQHEMFPSENGQATA